MRTNSILSGHKVVRGYLTSRSSIHSRFSSPSRDDIRPITEERRYRFIMSSHDTGIHNHILVQMKDLL